MSRPDICGLRYLLLILALLVANINDSNAILLPFGNQIPVIFNFGDSNSDTGSYSAAYGDAPYPNGITFFGNSSGRHSDGRLIIDFIDETSILQNRLPKPEDFSKALYTFDIGQNDLILLYFIAGDQLIAGDHAYKSLPDLIARISLSIEQIHELGARNFVIHNIGPLGCLPLFLEMYPFKPKDEIGCLISANEMAQQFNLLLKDQVSLLRTKLQDSSLVYVDIYSAKYSLIRDAKQFGFVYPFGYCCEGCMKNSNPFWNKTIADEIPPNVPCDDPSKYISWDSAHYTDAANQWIANKIFDSSLYDSNPTL